MRKGGKLEGWKVEKLGDVIQLEYGKPLDASKRSEDGKYPVYGANGEIARSNEYYYDKPTMIVGRKGSAGEINFTEKKFWALDVTYFVTFDDKKYDLQFLYYLLSKLELTKLAKGVKPGINRNDVYSIEVAIPPLPEQQRIVSVLDEAFASITQAKSNAERNLVNARELFETYKQSVFDNSGKGWELKTVGDVSEHSLGKMLDKQKNRGKNKKYLRNANVRWFEFDLSDVTEMRFLEEEAEKYTAIKGDLLICEGGYPGRAAIWQENYPIFFQKAIHRVRFHKPEYTKWFLYFLHSASTNGHLKKYLTGTGIQHFTGQALDRFVFPVPPVSEIRAIIGRLEALSAETGRLEEIYQQKMESLEELKKSVLQKAFAGEL